MAYNSVPDYKINFNIFTQHLYMRKANVENFLTNTKKFPRLSTTRADRQNALKLGVKQRVFNKLKNS
jgi:hypothetical protein